MADQKFEGRCTCGSVRYQLESAPMFVNCCHCSWCQRETGSSYVLNALIESDRFTVLEGTPEMILTPSASGKGQQIWRCPECRVALRSHYAGFGENISFVRVGTLDDAASITPDAHVFTATKQPWVQIPDDHQSFDEFYQRKEQWSDEQRARLRQAMSE